ncbi:NUP50 (Nucleoporin 50 kDa) protein [Actinidia rufa]|uniref:NUP50 (Nucleoporin 50 kDa) protein n=1 Tax=Actinidia rufa TaxID=165716 RepID=A0A7J0FZM8_9ERIC|nr:NUP50 (Nucleoporin 50 kDa) protein [Actinidia rufa]
MGDKEDTLPTSKKRAAGRELSRDNPGLDDEEEAIEQEAPSAPSSNPFAGIRLVPSTDSNSAASEATSKETEKKADEAGAKSVANEKKPDAVNEESKPELSDEKATEEDKTENEDNKDTEGATAENKDKNVNGNENIEKGAETAPLSSFRQLSSSQNAFTGLSGTGFSSSTFSFGSIQKDESSSGSFSGLKNDQPSYPSFGFSLSSNGNSSLFSTSGASIGAKSEGSGFPSMQEVPVETGEENEKAVFTADSVLFEYAEGGWKERGKGELKVNVSANGAGKARLVMRAKGNYRLILNASLYQDMKLTNMEKRGITFACMNSTGEGKDGLSTFALKFKDSSIVEEFRATVTEHKGNTAVVLKTPDNSPKASDD